MGAWRSSGVTITSLGVQRRNQYKPGGGGPAEEPIQAWGPAEEPIQAWGSSGGTNTRLGVQRWNQYKTGGPTVEPI